MMQISEGQKLCVDHIILFIIRFFFSLSLMEKRSHGHESNEREKESNSVFFSVQIYSRDVESKVKIHPAEFFLHKLKVQRYVYSNTVTCRSLSVLFYSTIN